MPGNQLQLLARRISQSAVHHDPAVCVHRIAHLPRVGCKVPGLHAETTHLLAHGDTRDKLVAQGQEVIGGTPEQFVAAPSEETARWAKVVKAANMKLD